MHHHRWVVRVSRNVGMHGGAMTQLSGMGGHLGWGIAWLSHVHTHWTTPRHIIPWHTLQPCGEKEVVVSGGDQLPTSGHEASPLGHGKASLEPKVGRGVTGARVQLPLWDPSLRMDSSNGNGNDSQVHKPPRTSILPPPTPSSGR